MARQHIHEMKLHVMILKEGKRFVAYAPSLDLSTSGKTFEEAKKRFGEIVDIFVEEIVESGTVDQVLDELGWERIKNEWRPPVVVSQELKQIQIPA
ncbi:MAG: type II toxin-antitoxin system HicB family antitoxin [Candidatus Kerfeldbacteria bacterium]|nr:type II toxin-antitoxin system HicB family antitoxin [Candidatus Kerfeldbacteria bacterium]